MIHLSIAKELEMATVSSPTLQLATPAPAPVKRSTPKKAGIKSPKAKAARIFKTRIPKVAGSHPPYGDMYVTTCLSCFKNLLLDFGDIT